MAESGGNRDNWLAVFAAMEQSIERSAWVEDPLDEPATVWVIPDEIGPMPAALRPRADRILGAQGEAIIRLEKRKRTVARHLSALRVVPTAHPDGPSPYLDITG